MLQIADSCCQCLFFGRLGSFALVVGSKILKAVLAVSTLFKTISQHINPAITDYTRADTMFEENRVHGLSVHEFTIRLFLESL